MLLTLGEGALMAKLDLKDAYCLVPVHPDDRPLLGMQWKERLFIDTMLSFGLCSAPNFFSAVADNLLRIFHEQGFTHALHYLDDVLLLGIILLSGGPIGHSSAMQRIGSPSCR